MSKELIDDQDYEALAAFRYALRRFLRFSTDAATSVGLEAQQYQAMLAIRGRSQSISIGELAEELQIKHHSAVGMVNRLAKGGLVERIRGVDDRRLTLVELTPLGRDVLARLAAAHLSELKKAAPAFDILIQQVGRGKP